MPQWTPRPTADQVTDLVTPVVVRIAVTIGLLSEVAATPATVQDLATRLGIDEPLLWRMARFLAARGILTLDRDGAVSSTSLVGACRIGRDRMRPGWTGAARRAGWIGPSCRRA
jgi:2,7-dihydroxy-5-methyl-1-naphthoate 7-O-methyltransferase